MLCKIKHTLRIYNQTFSPVQLLSRVRLFETPQIAAHQASCSLPTQRACSNSCPSTWWCHPTMSSSVICFSSLSSAFNLSKHQGLFQESVLRIRWPKYWSFSFSISPSNDYSRLISFRTDWFDLLVVQGILKSLLQHHSSKASILWHTAFLTVQLHIHTWLLEKL